MKIEEINRGEIFCIEGTKTFPKLKLRTGYVDMRDEYVNRENLNFEAEIMSEEEIKKEFEKYGMGEETIRNLWATLLNKYD